MSECQSGGNITRKRSNKRKLLRIWEGRVWKGWAAQLRKKIDEVAAEGDNTDDGISPKKKSSHTNLVTMMEASIEMKKKKKTWTGAATNSSQRAGPESCRVAATTVPVNATSETASVSTTARSHEYGYAEHINELPNRIKNPWRLMTIYVHLTLHEN